MGSVHLRQSRRRTDLRHRVRRKYHPMRVAFFQPAPTHPWSKYSSQPSAMRRLLFLIIGLLFLSSPTHARSRSVADSCLHILNTNPKLSSLEKCELLLTTIHNLNYEDNFISLTNLLIKEAAKSGSNYHLFYGYYEQGQYHIIHSGKIQEGLGFLFKSMEIAKSNQLKLEEGFASYMIGRAYYLNKNYPNTLKYLQAAAILFSNNSANPYLASTQLQIANTHFDLNNLDSALYLYQKVQKHFSTTGNHIALAYTQGNIGKIQMRKNNPDTARHYLNQAIKLLEEKQDFQALIPNYIYASENEVLAKNLSVACSHATMAYQLATKEKNPERTLDAYEQLMKVYAAMGDYEQAYDYQNKYLNLRDSLINMETVTQMANMRADFEIEQKEVEVELQQMAASNSLLLCGRATGSGSLVVVWILLRFGYRDGKRV